MKYYEPLREKTDYLGFRPGPTNQLQKEARSLKFRMQEKEGLYYLCSKNKDADQLCSHCSADCAFVFANAKSIFLMMWLTLCTCTSSLGLQNVMFFVQKT